MRKDTFSIRSIDLIHYMEDSSNTEYLNYRQERGVCGIVLVLKGESEYCFSDRRKRKLSSGEIAVFSSKTAYTFKNTSNKPFCHYTINFNLVSGDELPSGEAYLKVENTEHFRFLSEEILKYKTSPTAYSDMKSFALLYQLLAEVYENPSTEFIDSKEYRAIAPAIRAIETEYTNDINIEYLASICMMSQTNFRRVFKNVCAVSPIEYLIKVRIEHSKALLKHTGFSVSEIATMCGFKSSEHFCRTFKIREGETAHQARKNYYAE